MMDAMIREFRRGPLTTDLSQAQLMLQDHLVNYQTVTELYQFTCTNAQDILAKAATSSSVNVSREEIRRFLDQSEGQRDEWHSLWQHHQNKLQESVKLCELEQSISRVSAKGAAQMRSPAVRSPRFLVRGCCTKWRVQGQFS